MTSAGDVHVGKDVEELKDDALLCNLQDPDVCSKATSRDQESKALQRQW